jgi:cytoskeletal protein CcmA (bactofilin family)
MTDKETIIGPHTRIAGEMRGDQDVIVHGRVEGRVILNAVFTVEESAIVQADVEARVVLISGILVGNVSASEHIRLADKARVVGDLAAPRVVMEDGATYKGRLDMGAGAEADEHLRASRKDSDSRRSEPPRMTVPARVAASSASTVVAAKAPPPAPPPRLAAAIPPPDAEPPSLPSAEEAAAGGVASPAAWAKKKLNRRS